MNVLKIVAMYKSEEKIQILITTMFITILMINKKYVHNKQYATKQMLNIIDKVLKNQDVLNHVQKIQFGSNITFKVLMNLYVITNLFVILVNMLQMLQNQ